MATEQDTENTPTNDDVVRDTDADTRDVEETQEEEYSDTERRFSRIEGTLDRILGQLSALREAQGIMVENGAVITDDSDEPDLTDADSYMSPKDLDLLI